MRRILAIPLLAAVWIGSPAYASTQDPETRVITMPVAEPRERTVAPRFKEVLTGDSPQQTGDSPAPATLASAEQRGNRGGGGDRGSRGGGGDRAVNRGGDGSDRGGRSGGGDNRRWDGDRGSTRTTNRVVVVPRRAPSAFVGYSPYRRGYLYPAYSYDPWVRRYYGWSPVRYAPWGWIYGTSGLAAFGYGYSGYAPYYGYTGYGYNGPDPYYGYGSGYDSGYYNNRPSTFDTGGVRLKVRPREAQVFVDGAYAGLVNDFDGVFQELRLSQGGHKIEVRMPGFEPAFFDVHIQPGRSIDLREDLRPQR
jgi:hypothetical protein